LALAYNGVATALSKVYNVTYNAALQRVVQRVVGHTVVDREQSAFCPFSVGHRGCIGKNLAYIEMLLAIARVVYRYDFEEEDGWDEKLGGFPHVDEYGNYATKDGFVSVKDGPLVKFRERKTNL
jgi:cytochrome P450